MLFLHDALSIKITALLTKKTMCTMLFTKYGSDTLFTDFIIGQCLCRPSEGENREGLHNIMHGTLLRTCTDMTIYLQHLDDDAGTCMHHSSVLTSCKRLLALRTCIIQLVNAGMLHDQCKN